MQENFYKVLKYILFATALTPLVYTKLTPFPYVAGKTFFYRGLIEIALIIGAIYLIIAAINSKKTPAEDRGSFNSFFKSKLFIVVALFVFSAAVSTVLAVDSYRAFFGDVERGEGFLGLLHYFVFLVISLLIFRKDDWIKFFKISLGVLLVTIFYAWLQYFGVTKFPFALGESSQPGSFTGNPAFFSSYIIMSLALLAFVYFRSAKRSFWRYFSVFIALLSVITLFMTQIRGAILGLLVGVLFLAFYLALREERYRRAGVAVIVVLLLFGGTFWFTKHLDLWQGIPGLKRFAGISYDTPSVSTRLIALGVSWDALKEKPVFGWGPENYNVAYNKHYDPAYSLYAEDWFDRAHNKVAEVAVIQGGFGLIVYLSLFVILFRELFKRKVPGHAFVAAAFAAYFVQNFFLFDNVTSYIPFFAALGFVIAVTNDGGERRRLPSIRGANILKPVLGVLLIGVSVYSLYFYIYIPYTQSKSYILASRLRVGDQILTASEKFLYPYSFAQITIRSQFHDFLYNNDLFLNAQFRPLVNKSLAVLEETMEREPYDPRHFARLIEGYNELAKADETFFEQSRIFAERALALSPRRQGLYSHLAFALAGQEEYEKAIEADRRPVELTPNSAKAHLNLGIILALAAEDDDIKGTPQGLEYREEALGELDKALELGMTVLGGKGIYEGDDLTHTQFLLFIETDFKNMTTIYRGFDRIDRVFDVIQIALHEKFGTSRNPDFLHDGIVLGRYFRDSEAIIEYAKRLKEVSPPFAEDMDVIIDLVEKEKWDILDTL